MKTSDFSFDLPKNLIAQHPVSPRDASRLLVIDRATKSFTHDYFYHLPQYLSKGVVLVVNNSRVVPFRLFGYRDRHGLKAKVEVLLLQEIRTGVWEALANPLRKLCKGDRLVFGKKTKIIFEVGNRKGQIVQLKTLLSKKTLFARLEKIGTMPTPPYIYEKLGSPANYQTTFAKFSGSAAAPTAGLHFTPRVFRELSKVGVQKLETTLHVGLGTFQPITEKRIEEHVIHSERIFLDAKTARALNTAKAHHKRIIACGTTSLRTLESLTNGRGKVRATKKTGENTSIYITPGYKFRCVDGLLTNFHLPQSTLFVLVCAFAGTKLMKKAYAEAVRKKYRFFSFGDAMLIL